MSREVLNRIQGTGNLKEDMERYKDEILFVFKHADRLYYYNGVRDPKPLEMAIILTFTWKRQEFIEPLLSILRNGDGHCKYWAALSLLLYEDEDLKEEVRKHRGFEVVLGGCVVNTLSIKRLLVEQAKGTLARWAEVANTRTEDLIARLAMTDGKDRFRTWLQLVEQGVAAPADAVLDVYASLTLEEKLALLGGAAKGTMVGYNHVLEVLRRMLHDPVLQDKHLKILSLLWSKGDKGDDVRSEVERILREIIEESESEGNVPFEEIRSIRRFFYRASPAFREIYEKYADSEDERLQVLGWGPIVAMNSHESVCAVEKVLLTTTKAKRGAILKVLNSLEGLGRWVMIENRDVLLGLLYRAFETIPMDRLLYSALINAFESMSGMDFGSDGLLQPIGFDTDVARQTAEKCRSWYRERSKTMRLRRGLQNEGK